MRLTDKILKSLRPPFSCDDFVVFQKDPNCVFLTATKSAEHPVTHILLLPLLPFGPGGFHKALLYGTQRPQCMQPLRGAQGAILMRRRTVFDVVGILGLKSCKWVKENWFWYQFLLNFQCLPRWSPLKRRRLLAHPLLIGARYVS